MPIRPSKDTRTVSVDLPIQLLEEAKAFGEGRSQSFKAVLVEALRRHLAYPPPPPAPPPPEPPPEPFPDTPAPKPKRKGK